MRIATWNVDGISARSGELTAWLATEQPDVLCLQELKSSEANAVGLDVLGAYKSFWNCGGPTCGVSIHVRNDRSAKLEYRDEEHRQLRISIGRLHVTSVYVPLGTREDVQAKLGFFDKLRSQAVEIRHSGHGQIICGDMNVARTDRDLCEPRTPRDKRMPGWRSDERAAFNELVAPAAGGAELIDVVDMHRTSLDEPPYTWWSSRPIARTTTAGVSITSSRVRR
jgi:exodeoxyribonuclease-3